VVLDPPTFHNRRSTARSVRKKITQTRYPALPLVKRANFVRLDERADWLPKIFATAARFTAEAENSATALRPATAGFSHHRAEPAYLKTVWLRLDENNHAIALATNVGSIHQNIF